MDLALPPDCVLVHLEPGHTYALQVPNTTRDELAHLRSQLDRALAQVPAPRPAIILVSNATIEEVEEAPQWP